MRATKLGSNNQKAYFFESFKGKPTCSLFHLTIIITLWRIEALRLLSPLRDNGFHGDQETGTKGTQQGSNRTKILSLHIPPWGLHLNSCLERRRWLKFLRKHISTHWRVHLSSQLWVTWGFQTKSNFISLLPFLAIQEFLESWREWNKLAYPSQRQVWKKRLLY